MALCVWLLSLSTVFSRSIRDVAGAAAACPLMAGYYHAVRRELILFLHSFGSFPSTGALMNSAARNIRVHVFVRMYISNSLGHAPQGEIADCMTTL